MTYEEFRQEVLARASTRFVLGFKPTLLHAAIGIATEGGELLDAFKKNVFYGRTLDNINLQEELGDILWYVALAASELGVTFEQLMEQNTRKLEQRYGTSFSTIRAIKRDLQMERTILAANAKNNNKLEPSKIKVSKARIKKRVQLGRSKKRIRNKSSKH